MVTELGVKVKILRKNTGVKQEVLAKFLGLSKGQMCNLESGKRNFSLGQLEKICEYFNIDLSYFFLLENNDSCLNIASKVKLLFESNELTQSEKDEFFLAIMKAYLESK